MVPEIFLYNLVLANNWVVVIGNRVKRNKSCLKAAYGYRRINSWIQLIGGRVLIVLEEISKPRINNVNMQ